MQPDPTTQTVRLHVHVVIDYNDDDYDTGVTVDEWNALSDRERSNIVTEAWTDATQYDSGGIWPTTDGATGV